MPCWFTVRMISKNLPHHDGRKAEAWLVQHEQLRLAHQGAAHRQHLLLAAGKVPALCQLRSFRPGEQTVHPLKVFLGFGLILAQVCADLQSFPAQSGRQTPGGPPATWQCRWPRSGRWACPAVPARSTKMEPLCAFTRPEMVRIRVDLPAPLAPIRVTILPSGTFSDTPRKA